MLIYHYCSLDTLLKILSSKSIWLSDIRKMNDPGEFILGHTIVYNVMKSLLGSNAELTNSFISLGDTPKFITFSASFSKHSDNLSQWRAYGNDGEGVAIGFDSEIIKEINQIEIKGLFLNEKHKYDIINFLEVTYDKDHLSDLTKDIIESYTEEKHTDFMFLDTDTNILMINDLSKTSLQYKDDFYIDEGEIRCIYQVTNDIKTLKKFKQNKIKFRNGVHGLTPYIELDVFTDKLTAIKEIILGPKNKTNIEELKFMFDLSNNFPIKITKSSGNYR